MLTARIKPVDRNQRQALTEGGGDKLLPPGPQDDLLIWHLTVQTIIKLAIKSNLKSNIFRHHLHVTFRLYFFEAELRSPKHCHFLIEPGRVIN